MHRSTIERKLCCHQTACYAVVNRTLLRFTTLAMALVSGSVANAEVVYDFTTGVNTTVFAYKDRIPESPLPPTTENVPSILFSDSNYTRLVASDENRYATGNIGNPDRAASRFVFHIDQAAASIASMTVLWEGRAQNGGTVEVYLWNVATSSYDLLGTTTSTTDVNLSQVYAANAQNYVSESQTVTLLAVNTQHNKGLTTDYLKISISQCSVNADCNDGNTCTNDACNSGLCKYTNVAGSCSDNNPCTMNDFCSNGICQSGTPPNCAEACDDCNTASCDPLGAPGNCDRHIPRPDGIACDDNLYCTTADACVAGVCRGSSRECAGVSDQCHNGVCNENSDSCEAQPVLDGTACHDDQFCTIGDICTAGVCGGSPRSCAQAGDQCNEGVCDEASDACRARPLADGTNCNDGNFCSVEDHCAAGQCSGAVRDCATSGDPCNRGVCNEEQDACIGEPIEDGSLCDDGLFCTAADICTQGSCAGVARDCSALSDQCNSGVCNENIDACTAAPVADGAGCDDGFYCTINDVCVNGTCAGILRDCSQAGDQCNDGFCSEDHDSCEPRPKSDGIACDDGFYCTVEDSCTGGACGGGLRDCAALNNQCNAGFCLEESDTCTSIALPDGIGCDDDHFCTIKDMCTAGVCGGVARDCSHLGDQCNTGVCDDQAQECRAAPIEDGSACNDAQFCTVGDACINGLCSGSARDCSGSSDQCNAGVCNEIVGACVAEPFADGTDCDDHNACNVGESCHQGSCAGGGAPNCPGVIDCHVITCDPAGPEGNCASDEILPDGTDCDDGAFCTAHDQCLEGACTGGATPCASGLHCNETDDSCLECLGADHCDDGVACTDDSCDNGVCHHVANDLHCPDNSLHCDGIEYCDETLDCQSTGDPCPTAEYCDEATDSCGDCLVDENCNDHVNCTDDKCISGGCVYLPADEKCTDDDEYCNGREICDPQAGCVSTGNPCTAIEFCNEQGESCDECRFDSDCDDNNACTAGHACVLGVCQTAHAVDCSGESDQCNTAACDPAGEPGNCNVMTPVSDGTECDDEMYCTVGDQCTAGACGGVARDCKDASDQCNVGICNEEASECQPQPIQDGTFCDDGLFCTTGDSCLGGLCKGAARDCSSSADQCHMAVCNEANGSCDAIPLANGTTCDDDLYCTVEDSCQEGICRGAVRDCTAIGDQCKVGICSEKDQACTAIAVPDGVSCNDANACHIGESCLAGSCTGGAPPDCSAQADQCNAASCDPAGAEGNCDRREQIADGTECDDSIYCTADDVCAAGVCSGGLRDCSLATNECNMGMCNELAQRCESHPVANGVPCDDGSYCTVKDACVLGACLGDLRDCSALTDQCNAGACNEETDVCEARPVEDGVSCDDGLFCTIEDACKQGACAGSTRSCGDFENQCNRAMCNEDSDTCEAQPLEDGTVCDDALYCTVLDTCQSGACTGGKARDCGDFTNQCNTGACNEDSDACEAMPVKEAESCDDGLYCTVEEACHEGQCVGRPRDCGSTQDQCSNMVCSEEQDACEVEPENGTSCDDGYECTSNDACKNGVCFSSRTYGLDEWNDLTGCLAGTDQGVDSPCECLDLDGDGHVDLIDVAEFMRQFDGQ